MSNNLNAVQRSPLRQLSTDLANRNATPRRNTTSSGAPVVVHMLGPNGLYSGGDGNGQTVYAQYTKDSTPEDPIVRISGNSHSGKYDKVVHLNDIDPSNASYAEMCALIGHQKATGAYQGTSPGGFLMPLPLDVPRGDYASRQDFVGKIQDSISHNRQYGNHQMADTGSSLLSFYQALMASKTKSVPETQFEQLKGFAEHRQAVDFALFSLFGKDTDA